jgi:hypothetical protein
MICYFCAKSLPPGAANCPNCGHKVYGLHDPGAPATARRIDGCRFGDPSPSDYRANPQVEAPPRKVDLRAMCSPIEDQGALGSCTANATVGALEYRQRVLKQPQINLSRIFVYFNARRMSGRVNVDSGAQIAESMAAVMAYGAPAEQHWPYNPARFADLPPPQIYDEAQRNQPGEYARVDRGEGVVGALARGFPVVFGIQLPMRCYQEAGATGVIPAPTERERHAPPEGGHSMLIVGYDLDQGTYLLRNSWGTGWGDQGYARVPISVMDEYARPDAYWIVGNLKDADFKVIRPARTPAAGSVAGMAAAMRDEIRSSLTKDIADSQKAVRDRLRPKPRDER